MRRLLVVEDTEITLKLYKNEFKRYQNLEVTYAKSCKEAMALVYNQSFDLYIIDYILEAGFSGLDLVRILQKEENIFNRIIMISSQENNETITEAYELGVSNFLPKPIPFDILAALINRNLKMLEHNENNIVKTNSISLDSKKMKVLVFTGKRKNDCKVTLIEFRILFLIISRKGAVVTKDALSYLGKNSKDPMDNKAIEMHIVNLRKKSSIIKKFLKTKRGMGYSWDE